MNGAAFLEIDGVGMRFGGLWALSDVSFEIPRGTVLSIIGPNGSGKTTMMNVISGVYKPTTGTVRYKGIAIASLPSYEVCKIGIARTFQIVKPFANLTVRENVAVGSMFGSDRKATAEAFERAQEFLETVGLARVADRPASDLTIPDRKRLEIAKALALDPEVLLLDEVMAGLNATEIDEALDLLRSVNARGVTLVVVEHLMKAIMSISQRVVVLAEGKKIAEGTPLEITRAPQVIEAYLGSRFAQRQREMAALQDEARDLEEPPT